MEIKEYSEQFSREGCQGKHLALKSESFKLIEEGKARVMVPVIKDESFPPRRSPVFYNPAMKFDRDLSVCLLNSLLDGGEVLDPLCGTGIRGIRYVLETPLEKGILNDVSPMAFRVSRRNVELNSLSEKLSVRRRDANALMHCIVESGRRIDAVDVDPYGSPVKYISSATRVLRRRGILMITCTDTSSLMGTYPRVSLRRYSCWIPRTEFREELACRALVQFVIREGAKQDVFLKPIFSYVGKHYLRAFFCLESGARKVDKALKMVDFLDYDPKSGRTSLGEGRIGPIWLGPLFSKEHLKIALDWIESKGEYLGIKVKGFIKAALLEENNPPFYYDLHLLHSRFKGRCPAMGELIEKLRENGFRASRTLFSPTGIRTDCEIDELKRIWRAISHC